MNILIVDHSELIIERLEEMIAESNMSCTVIRAISYEQAAQQIQSHQPFLVIMDSQLEKNHSRSLLKEIKMTQPDLPVIVLANHLDEQVTAEFSASGADFLLDKYHEFEKIPAIIKSLISP